MDSEWAEERRERNRPWGSSGAGWPLASLESQLHLPEAMSTRALASVTIKSLSVTQRGQMGNSLPCRGSAGVYFLLHSSFRKNRLPLGSAEGIC